MLARQKLRKLSAKRRGRRGQGSREECPAALLVPICRTPQKSFLFLQEKKTVCLILIVFHINKLKWLLLHKCYVAYRIDAKKITNKKVIHSPYLILSAYVGIFFLYQGREVLRN